MVKTVRLLNFRNLENTSLNVEGLLVGLVGRNGEGKTNLLEALSVGLNGWSWRATQTVEMVRFGESSSFVEIENDGLRKRVEIRSGESDVRGQRYLVNGIARAKQVFQKELGFAVVFEPGDLNIVSGSPAVRRSFLRRFEESVDVMQRKRWGAYEKVLVRRNRLLKEVREGLVGRDSLDFWNQKLIELGVEIVQWRRMMLAELKIEQPLGFDFVSNIGGSDVDEISESFERKIRDGLQKEIWSGTSQYGPQKDDFILKIGERDLCKFGSRGEQRKALLMMMYAMVQFADKWRGEQVVLILDDVFGELDRENRIFVQDMIAGRQVFVSGIESEDFVGFDVVYRVCGGILQK
jgi:DNA replication and repair protein RecF